LTYAQKKAIYFGNLYNFGKFTGLADNCCNYPITSLPYIALNIYQNNEDSQSVNTASGTFESNLFCDTIDFGTMAFKKDLNLTIFSQYKNLIDNYECYYSDNSLSKFIVHIPRINFNLEFFRIEDILITNLRPYCQFLHRDPISMQINSTTKYQSKYNYKKDNIEVQHQNFVHKLSKDFTLKDSTDKMTFGPTVISKRYPFSDSQHNEIYANIDEDQHPTKKTKKNKKIKYQINKDRKSVV
jgi:hypothetical protein